MTDFFISELKQAKIEIENMASPRRLHFIKKTRLKQCISHAITGISHTSKTVFL